MVQSLPTVTYQTQSFNISGIPDFKSRTLFWLQNFNTAIYLDSNDHSSYPGIDKQVLVAAGVIRNFQQTSAAGAFQSLKSFWKQEKTWLFGHLGYDLKNDTEALTSIHPDHIDFPVIHFFQPKYLIEFLDEQIQIHSSQGAPSDIFQQILTTTIPTQETFGPYAIKSRFSKSEYLETVEKIQNHILEGDIYELNFCQEFFAEQANINPLLLFDQLNKKSKTPFATYYKYKGKHLLSASPERFLQKKGTTIISQPIKGTIARGKSPIEDFQLKDQLKHSEKDRAENVMIVDLVRNDLAKTALPGTVKVKDLFGIYAFEQVFQMISTVTAQVKPETSIIDIIKNAFPMGSMTGAPKVKSMELIEKLERSQRGVYSGAVGYFSPDGDFDFNVVIRSFLYNEVSKYLSFQVGGAIVYDSIPEQEYAECLLKAKGLLQSINSTINLET